MTAKNRSTSVALLREHGIRPKRRLGQNFLDDPAALMQVAAAADIGPSDEVLEIGCGLGSLTRVLAERAHRVVAVEIDSRLAAVAQKSLADLLNVRVVRADILETPPAQLGLQAGYLVAANIPYYITSPILRHLLESQPRPQRIVLTIQEEVAARICSLPPDMSLLAVSVQVFGRPEIVVRIPAAAFHPVPDVDSAVVRIDCYDEPVVATALLPLFFRVVRAGFSQRRKMLSNALASGLGRSSTEARILLLKAKIDPARRAETVALDEWIRLCGALAGISS